MASDYTELLREQVVIAAMSAALLDSHPGVSDGHEEGGFILRRADGQIEILRWVTGVQNSIRVPPHPGCKIEENDILASFHTHPNTGSNTCKNRARPINEQYVTILI